MYKYKCAKCQGEQYSASENKESEPCIYCDAESVILDEKTPEGTAIPTGASGNNQLHDTTESDVVPEKVLKETIELRDRFQDIYSRTGVASMESPYGIQLSTESFIATFKEFESIPFGPSDSQYTEKLHASYGGTVFFCIR